MRVLYVDDDRVNALLFAAACRFAPAIELETASSGQEALELVRTWRPDLLVVDLHLPDTDGYQLLPRLRQALGAPGLPAILCTADAAWQVEGPASLAGYSACWTKPVVLQTVISTLGDMASDMASNMVANQAQQRGIA